MQYFKLRQVVFFRELFRATGRCPGFKKW